MDWANFFPYNNAMPYLYAFIIAVGTLIGGWLPFTGAFKKLDSRYLVGFAAGAMLGIALFDLIPESAGAGGIYLALGFFVVYLLEKLVLIHVHAVDEEAMVRAVGWVPVIGIALESLIDGLAIAVGFAVAPALGLTIALAVLAHELPRGFTTSVIMQRARYSMPIIWLVLLVDALFTPLGVAAANFFPAGYFEELLAFTAGVFLYVGAGDLLPEAHRRFNWQVVFSVILGAAVIWLISAFVV